MSLPELGKRMPLAATLVVSIKPITADRADVTRRVEEVAFVDGKLTRSINAAFYDSYNELGFGCSESVCVAGLCEELTARGHLVNREVKVAVHYKGKIIAWQRLDLLVDNRVIVEVKAGDVMASSARLQLSSYLRATGLEVGLLLHYGPKPRITRVFLPRKPTTQSK